MGVPKNNISLPLHGTIKIINKSSFLTNKAGGQNLYEDYNIQYMEPLEGRGFNGENEDENDLAFKDLNKTKKDYHFVNELGLNDNLLRTKEIFDKINKQSKLNISSKPNAFSSFNNIFIKNKIRENFDDDGIIDINDRLYEDYEDKNMDEEKGIKSKRKKRRIKRKNNLVSVAKSFLSKVDMKKYLNNKKRVLTYDNVNDMNKYLNKDDDDVILNKEERSNIPRRINSGKITPKFIDKLREKNEYINEVISEDYSIKRSSDEDEIDKILGFKRKKNIILEPFTLLDENYNGIDDEDEIFIQKNKNKNDLNKQKNSSNNIHKQNNNNDHNNNINNNSNKIINKIDGKKEEIKGAGEVGEKEKEGKGDYKNSLLKLEEDIKRRNLNNKKKKKKHHQNQSANVNLNVNEEKKKEANKPKKNLFLGRNKNVIRIQFKDITNTKLEDKKHRLKSPAINSILNDISNLSNSIIKGNKKEKKIKDIQYDQNFGYEYWKENKFRESILHPLSSNKRGGHSFRSINSTNAPDENLSIGSTSFSWLLNNNYSYVKEDILNPYSVNWTKKVLQNSFNRKIKLKKQLSGVPEIELMSRIKSSLSYSQPKMNYNLAHIVDNKNNNYYKKNNKIYGRIYNNNDVEFPLIYKS